jgi:hypothetical protein
MRFGVLGPLDVQVGAPPAAVGDREQLVGRKPAEGQQRDGDTGGRRDQHIGRCVGAQGNRPSAVRATSAAATRLPVLRQRPSGTSVYKTQSLGTKRSRGDLVVVRDRTPVYRPAYTVHELLDQCPC